ncbi:dUTP diphosphatase [Candidatus Falkowbacteria bacterium]|jgi:dTMP kinase|nr:dUTP diphosphatase [Patescibacteria group bacterium]MDD3435071.1 dUTP diphosphatase [Patescibacteria group bacterium]MDD4466475.1 dUTP diphosphatase [Patescibacteria group bacterium]NCU42800.1 dUTP diphosphatase [Candidatus Falkowbacteria bacterium]
MTSYSGKLIVIDGTDGSGKTTQLNLLAERLKQEGFLVEIADFPQYNTKSAGLVEEYLSGKYGGPEDVTPYQASIFYAADRFDANFKIRKWLEEGKIVLSNRYVSASMGHQGAKIHNSLERKVFFSWLNDLEYKLFNIPHPDLSLILHVPATVAFDLAKKRAREDWVGKTKDIHENNLNHLRSAEEVYLEIANTIPGFTLIECSLENNILERGEISELIWVQVRRLLNGDSIKKESSFKALSEVISKNKQIQNHKEFFFRKDEAQILIPRPSEPEEIKTINSVLKVERLSPEAKLPTKAHLQDAGLDLYSAEAASIAPYQQMTISTGIRLAIPQNQVGLIWDKSGLAKEGLSTLGGVIDAGYRGEILVLIKNLGQDIYHILPGQKIAQLIIQPLSEYKIEEGPILEDTDRGQNGFGSSGRF